MAQQINLKTAPAVLLSEKPLIPTDCPEGVPLSQKTVPMHEHPPAVSSTFVPSLTKRAQVDPRPLVDLLASKGQQVWSPELQSQTNVPFTRPAHDRWGVGKVMFIHCDDFLQRRFYL